MKKNTALWILGSLIILTCVGKGAAQAFRSGDLLIGHGDCRAQAPPQAARAPRWQSREEYDAYMAMANQTNDLELQIALAESFLQRFPASDFKSGAYLTEMQCYSRLNDTGRALTAARNALRFDRDNLEALGFLSYVFPFTFKPDDRNAESILTRAKNDAQHGLDVLQRVPKPPNVSDQEFRAVAMQKRAIFNDVLGFAALSQKDYAGAIKALKAAVHDNPNDTYAFYRMGLAYLYSTPTDYHHGIWYVARAAGLARTSGDPSSQEFLPYLRKVFVDAVGTDAALEDTITRALARVDPPEGPGQKRRSRPRPVPGQGASTGTVRGTSGNSSTTQNNPQTTHRITVVVIYPSWLPTPPDEAENPTPPPDEEASATPPPSPVDIDTQIAEQPNNPVDLTSQQQPWQDVGPPSLPEPPQPEPAAPMTVLVFKDGHQVEIRNYAIMGKNLVWFSGELSKKVPIADLDLPATRKVNEGRGLTFAGPDEP